MNSFICILLAIASAVAFSLCRPGSGDAGFAAIMSIGFFMIGAAYVARGE